MGSVFPTVALKNHVTEQHVCDKNDCMFCSEWLQEFWKHSLWI